MSLSSPRNGPQVSGLDRGPVIADGCSGRRPGRGGCAPSRAGGRRCYVAPPCFAPLWPATGTPVGAWCSAPPILRRFGGSPRPALRPLARVLGRGCGLSVRRLGQQAAQRVRVHRLDDVVVEPSLLRAPPVLLL